MKVRELMTKQVIRIHPEEPVEVAARTLTQYNIGALPVCGRDGQLYGMVTDRDLVTRCMAAGRNPGSMKVRDVMTGQVISAGPDMEASAAAHLMGRQQVRRLPVVENGKLCGMVSLGDLAGKEESQMDAADALMEISENLRIN
jgi:CBS domain-containing protein